MDSLKKKIIYCNQLKIYKKEEISKELIILIDQLFTN